MAIRKNPTIGCCGTDCGLCPRFYTDGSSRCPGCGGEGFEQKHPSCGALTCCVKKRGLEICAECGDFPCPKYDKDSVKRDSFVTHAKMTPNQRLIAEVGMGDFLEQQKCRITFLKTALDRHDDGRSKNFLCLAAALLSIDSLNEALALADSGDNLKAVLTRFAQKEEIELILRS